MTHGPMIVRPTQSARGHGRRRLESGSEPCQRSADALTAPRTRTSCRMLIDRRKGRAGATPDDRRLRIAAHCKQLGQRRTGRMALIAPPDTPCVGIGIRWTRIGRTAITRRAVQAPRAGSACPSCALPRRTRRGNPPGSEARSAHSGIGSVARPLRGTDGRKASGPQRTPRRAGRGPPCSACPRSVSRRRADAVRRRHPARAAIDHGRPSRQPLLPSSTPPQAVPVPRERGTPSEQGDCSQGQMQDVRQV